MNGAGLVISMLCNYVLDMSLMRFDRVSHVCLLACLLILLSGHKSLVAVASFGLGFDYD